MAITITVGGKPVPAKDIKIDYSIMGTASASISFPTGTTLRTGDHVNVDYDGKVEFAGIVTSATYSSSGITAEIEDATTLKSRMASPPPLTETEFQYGDVVRWKRRDATNESYRYMIISRSTPGWYDMIPVDVAGMPNTLWGDNFERVP